MPPSTTERNNSTFDVNMISRRQRRELDRTGSFTTSRGQRRDATGAFLDEPRQAPQLSPIQSPTPASSLSPEPVPDIPAPTAPETQETFMTSLNASLDGARAAQERLREEQRANLDRDAQIAQAGRQEALSGLEEVQTNPQLQRIEAEGRDRYQVDQNFNANQRLIGELESLMAEGNEAIRVAQGRAVSGRVLQQSVSKTVAAVEARAGVLQAVLNARNGQIAQANTLIDRTRSAYIADTQDVIDYNTTLLNMHNADLIRLETEQLDIAEEERTQAQAAVERAEATSDYIKSLMISPETAQFMADAGVTLEDSVDDIKKKMGEQRKRDAFNTRREELVAEGYDILPYKTDDSIEFKVGGKTIHTRVRPGSTLDLEQQKLARQSVLRGTGAATPNPGTNQIVQSGVMGTDDDPIPDLLLQTAGGRLLTQSEAEPLTNSVRVIDGLKDLQDTLANVNTDPVVGIFRKINPYDLRSATIDAAITQVVPQLARGTYGEVGVLTDADMARYADTLPNLTSTEEQNKAIMALTLRKVRSAFVAQLEGMVAAGRDVSGYVDIYTRFNQQIASLEADIGVGSDPDADFDAEFDEVFSTSSTSANPALGQNVGLSERGESAQGFLQAVGRFFFGE